METARAIKGWRGWGGGSGGAQNDWLELFISVKNTKTNFFRQKTRNLFSFFAKKLSFPETFIFGKNRFLVDLQQHSNTTTTHQHHTITTRTHHTITNTTTTTLPHYNNTPHFDYQQNTTRWILNWKMQFYFARLEGEKNGGGKRERKVISLSFETLLRDSVEKFTEILPTMVSSQAQD